MRQRVQELESECALQVQSRRLGNGFGLHKWLTIEQYVGFHSPKANTKKG